MQACNRCRRHEGARTSANEARLAGLVIVKISVKRLPIKVLNML